MNLDPGPENFRLLHSNVLLFEDGLLGFDFKHECYLSRHMHEFNARFEYEQQVRLLLKLLEECMLIARNETLDPQWLFKAEIWQETCPRALQGFSEHGDFTQWRKIAYYEQSVLLGLLGFLLTHRELWIRDSIQAAHFAWREWREVHPDYD